MPRYLGLAGQTRVVCFVFLHLRHLDCVVFTNARSVGTTVEFIGKDQSEEEAQTTTCVQRLNTFPFQCFEFTSQTDRPLTSPAVSSRGGLRKGQKSSLYAMFKSRAVVF